MKHLDNTSHSGFTLIEILLYMALTTIMLVIMGGVGVNVFSGFVKAKAAEELQYNTHFVTEKIRTIASQANSIDQPAVGQSSPQLTFIMNNVSKSPTTIDVVEGRLRIQEGAAEPQFISGSGIDFSSVEFSNVTYDNGSGSVRLVLKAGLINPNDRALYFSSSTVYTTLNLLYP